MIISFWPRRNYVPYRECFLFLFHFLLFLFFWKFESLFFLFFPLFLVLFARIFLVMILVLDDLNLFHDWILFLMFSLFHKIYHQIRPLFSLTAFHYLLVHFHFFILIFLQVLNFCLKFTLNWIFWLLRPFLNYYLFLYRVKIQYFIKLMVSGIKNCYFFS